MEWSTIAFQLVLLFVFFILYINKRYSYWADRGINGPLGLPFLGNFWEQLWRGQLVCERRWMAKYGKIYGTYNFLKPSLTILDAELIKQVMTRDFALFVNRRKNRSDHQIWGRNLFGVEDDDWKRIRSCTSPSFTSGKLRAMVPLMTVAVQRLERYIDTAITSKSSPSTKTAILDIKKVISGFSIDVIASTSFATQTDANGDRAGVESPFIANGQKVFLFHPLRILGLTFIPAPIRRLFGFTLNLDPAPFRFFVDLSRAVIAQRRANPNLSTKRHVDLVQLLIDSKVADSELGDKNYDKLTAKEEEGDDNGKCQVTLSHALFELARHPEAQARLAEELKNATQEKGITSEHFINSVLSDKATPYLEAVIKETLRLYPPVPRLNRRVAVDGYRLGGVELKKDMGVEIPAYAVHRHPDYYGPKPEQFNPDRFLPENRHLLVPYTFLPFGNGPRN
ncbi:Cytochrome P450 3A4 [Tyrophagus putrescentiae]|nr:Cytochrome P450 3A4 [Tyrophagus putrescentiae]